MKNIVYTQKGMWKFYHDEKLGLCFYEPGGTTPMILFDKGGADFDADCDESGCIYLMCQDDKNNLYLFYYDRQKWNKQCILESKSVVPYDKNFRIINVNGWINTFYAIRHAEKYLLIHHILNNEGKPQVIETFDAPFVYSALSDSKGNLYIIYEKGDIGYKEYVWQNKEWSSFVRMAKLPAPLCGVQAIADRKDELNLVCTCRKKQEYSVYFVTDSVLHEIVSGARQNPQPAVLYKNEYYVLFQLGGRLLQCTAENTENGFTKPTYYFPGSFSPHSLFKLSSTVSLSQKGVFASVVYGTELRRDRFDAAIIGDIISEIDFSLPAAPTEQKPEIEEYISRVAEFDPEIVCLKDKTDPKDEEIRRLKERIAELEQYIKKHMSE